MKHTCVRAAVFVAFVLACITLTHTRALAIVEYCGADVHVTPLDPPKPGAPAATYAMTFSANSSRTATGLVAFHSADGKWYDVTFPAVNLEQRVHRYQSTAVQFTRTDYLSQPVFVTFPRPVTFTTAFVSSAAVTNEHVLGWDANAHACAGIDPDVEFTKTELARDITLVDPDPKPTMPAAGVPVLHPSIGAAPGSTNCAVPFTEARVTKPMPPDFPLGYQIEETYTALIEVAVNEKGTLDDAWVYAPSGIKAFDESAMRSARLSTYQPRRSFCENVPGVYLFRAVFRPR